MQISEAGLDLIKQSEELRLSAYQDQGGIWTVGWGHTRGVKDGDLITKEEERFRWMRPDGKGGLVPR